MTERDPRLDELVSAHLDGESSADEAARVTGDAELRERLERFAAVRDAVRDVPAPDDAARHATIGRVLAAFDTPGRVGRVATIASVRPRRIAASRLLAIAAALLAVAFLGAAVGMLSRGGGGDDAAGSVARTMAEDGGDTAGGSAAVDAPTMAPQDATAYRAEAGELGSFPDLDALRRRAEELATTATDDSGATPSTPTTAAGAESTDAESRRSPLTCALPDGPRWRAEVDGRAVIVVVGTGTITVIDTADCTTVAAFAR